MLNAEILESSYGWALAGQEKPLYAGGGVDVIGRFQ
jgi:hypothetical protein